jgi:hypothetical protein
MSRQLFEEARKVLTQEAAVKLDPVGQEDKDIDNDGDADKTDSYLKKRRSAISAAIAKSKNESALSEEDLAKLKAILGEMKKKEAMEKEEEGEKESEKEEKEMKNEAMMGQKTPPKGPNPVDIPAYMRKDNARQKFPVDLKDLKKEEVEEVVSESDLPKTKAKEKTIKVKHKTSGREKVIVDNPAARKANAAMGFYPVKEEVEQGVEEGATMPNQDPRDNLDRLDPQHPANRGMGRPLKVKIQRRLGKDVYGQGRAAAGMPAIHDYATKPRLPEEVDFELIEKLNFEVSENPSYQDYFKAALKIAEVDSFSELDEEDQQYIMSEMEKAYRENDISFILEADMMGDMNDTVQRLRKAGHKVEDMGKDYKGNPYYVYVDKGSMMRRKVTYRDGQKVTQNMGKAQPEKEEDNQ